MVHNHVYLRNKDTDTLSKFDMGKSKVPHLLDLHTHSQIDATQSSKEHASIFSWTAAILNQSFTTSAHVIFGPPLLFFFFCSKYNQSHSATQIPPWIYIVHSQTISANLKPLFIHPQLVALHLPTDTLISYPVLSCTFMQSILKF